MFVVEKNGKTLANVVYEYQNGSICEQTYLAIYVRPETNKISCEQAIAQAVIPYGNVIYMANLNGEFFKQQNLIKEHYPSQYHFANEGKSEVLKYPEMVEEFEKHFGISFEEAPVIGAFEAVNTLGKSAEEIFTTFVDSEDFLKIYGQSFKKIDGFYIINYDIPCLLQKHDSKTNVFILGISLKDPSIDFQKVNMAIFNNLSTCEECKVPENSDAAKLDRFEQMRRAYHISRNHFMAMFDLKDFVITQNGHINFSDTPLGRKIIETTQLTEKDLVNLKNNPVIYLKQGDDSRKLINIVEGTMDLSIDECLEIIKKWDVPS